MVNLCNANDLLLTGRKADAAERRSMAFYVTMSAFIAANLALIGFEMRRGPSRAGQLSLVPVNRRSTHR